MPVELSDEEAANLRAEAGEAKKIRAEHEAEKKLRAAAEAEVAAARKKYDDDMKQVAAYLQQQNQPPPEKKEDDDPDAIISRKDLLRAQEETQRRAAEQSAQHAVAVLRNQRSINKQLAVQRLGARAEKYMAEIDAHLDKLAPEVAAQPTAYDEVFKYVRAAHIDEELAEREAERQAQEREAESEGVISQPGGAAPSRPVPRSEPVSPGSGANATRPIARAQANRPRLTDEQRRIAAGFGMSDEDYAGKWATDDEMVNNDPYGLKGRQRV